MPTPAHGEGLAATSWPGAAWGPHPIPPHPIPPQQSPARAQPVGGSSDSAGASSPAAARDDSGRRNPAGTQPFSSAVPTTSHSRARGQPRHSLALQGPLLGELQGPPYPLYHAERLCPVPQSPYNPPSSSPGGAPTEAGTTGATHAARGEAGHKRAVRGMWGHGAHSWGGSTPPCPLPMRLGAVVGGRGGTRPWMGTEQPPLRPCPLPIPSRAQR